MHLDKVSRSFAFCIARLDEPLRYQVGLSYLICRILDSIEDAKWPSKADQFIAFETFINWLDGSRSSENRPKLDRAMMDQTVMHWLQKVEASLSKSEVALLKDASMVFSGLRELSPEVRDVIVPSVTSMALGMKACLLDHSDREFAGGPTLKLRNLAEVNRYCFFVAGVVGELLTGLVRRVAKLEGIEFQSSVVDSFRFGLFLQKVNIIKDRNRDLEEGRDLIPSTGEFVRSAFGDLKSGFRYLQSIPSRFHSYRLFCAWSLFLGMESLKASARGARVSRLDTALLLGRVELALRDQTPTALINLFAEFESRAHQAYPMLLDGSMSFETSVAKASPSAVQYYREFYRGAAEESDLMELARLA